MHPKRCICFNFDKISLNDISYHVLARLLFFICLKFNLISIIEL